MISPGTEAVDIATEQVLAHSKRIRVVLSRYFTGDALAWMTESLHDAMQNQADFGVRDVSGGAKLVTITDVQLDGPMAVTVTATAQIWLNTHPAKGAMVEATDIEAVWTYTLHLTKSSDGNWLIDEWTADPEPGSHP